jgi:hypothetical protein
VNFETVSDKRMKIELDPTLVAAYSPTTLTSHITLDEPDDSDNGSDLQNVLVTRTIETIDHTKLREQKTTNSRGMASFELPPLAPSTKIKIEAEKPDYYADPVELKVDGNILEFEPEELESSLKPSTETEQTLKVMLHNKLGSDLTIDSIRWVGNFSPVLDKEKMDSYLKQLEGKVLRGGEDTELEIAKTALNTAYPVFQAETVKLSLYMEVTNPNITQKLPFTIPVTITIGLTGVPTEQQCLTVDEPEWLGTTQNNAIEHTFTLLNNCKVEGKPVVLSNLQAVLKWNGNAIGNIDLSLSEGSNENSANTQTLLPGEETVLFDQTMTGTSYYGKLAFTPKSEKLGQTTDFSITFYAETQTDSGTQKVSSNPIEGRILIASLETCLSYGANASLSTSGEVNVTIPSNTDTSGNNSTTGTDSTGGTNGTAGSNGSVQPNYSVQPVNAIFSGSISQQNSFAQTQTAEFQSSFLPDGKNLGKTGAFAEFQSAGSDAEEIFVKVPYGQEGSLTIDSTN